MFICSVVDQESLRNINAAAFFAFKGARLFVTVKPAAVKTLSDGADVAGIQSTPFASLDIIGSLSS